MNVVEEALLFPCAGELLPAIIAWPQALPAAQRAADDQGGRCGVLIVVGGPQYRVGSHRQFLLLARRLASKAYPVLRFDHRGMGDASGEMRSFEAISTDIGAAIDAFQRACPTLQRIVIWGLCDAASAALLYVHGRDDPRIVGLVLLNPWVRSPASLAQTHIKHYYGQRLLQGEFWRKLLSGRMHVLQSIAGLLSSALAARRASAGAANGRSLGFQDRMAEGWRHFPGKLLLILSGQDYTAKEFLEFSASNADWSGLAEAAKVHRIDLADADHTFSSAALRAQVEDATLAWLASLNSDGDADERRTQPMEGAS